MIYCRTDVVLVLWGSSCCNGDEKNVEAGVVVVVVVVTSRGNWLFVLQTQPLSSPEIPGWRRQSGVSPEAISFHHWKKTQTKLTARWQQERHIKKKQHKNLLFIYFLLQSLQACSSFSFPARTFSEKSQTTLWGGVSGKCDSCFLLLALWEREEQGEGGGRFSSHLFFHVLETKKKKTEMAAWNQIDELRVLCFAAGFAVKGQ